MVTGRRLSNRGVMIVAYGYPPRGGVGSLRAVRLAKHLTALGWRVSILTAAGGRTSLQSLAQDGEFPGVDVLSAPYVDRAARLAHWIRPIRRQRRADAHDLPTPRSRSRRRSWLWLTLRSLILFPDDQVGWISGAIRTGFERLQADDTAVIISTSPPESAHIIASRLKARTGIPWVADFRDPWGFSHLRDPSCMDPVHVWAEARTVSSADAVVTVSRGWSLRFQTLYPHLRHEVIPNGYDSQAAGTSPAVTAGVFRLVYTGKLDIEEQNPRPLFQAVAAAIREQTMEANRIRVVFNCYGDTDPAIQELARAEGLGEIFEWGGPLDQRSSEAQQREADVLLLFGWRRDPDCIPAKLFDYLAANRRILVLAPSRGEPAALITSTGRGAVAESSKQCQMALVRWYQEWTTYGRLDPGGDIEVVRRHSFEERARQYSQLLDDLCGVKQRPWTAGL